MLRDMHSSRPGQIYGQKGGGNCGEGGRVCVVLGDTDLEMGFKYCLLWFICGVGIMNEVRVYI
jgi:hypothetical protein